MDNRKLLLLLLISSASLQLHAMQNGNNGNNNNNIAPEQQNQAAPQIPEEFIQGLEMGVRLVVQEPNFMNVGYEAMILRILEAQGIPAAEQAAIIDEYRISPGTVLLESLGGVLMALAEPIVRAVLLTLNDMRQGIRLNENEMSVILLAAFGFHNLDFIDAFINYVEIFPEYGISLEITNMLPTRATPLMIATATACSDLPEPNINEIHLDMVRTFINAHANIDTQDCFGHTPLMVAAHRNSLPVAQALIDGHADVNIQDRQGHRALFYAHNQEMRNLLAAQGAIE